MSGEEAPREPTEILGIPRIFPAMLVYSQKNSAISRNQLVFQRNEIRRRDKNRDLQRISAVRIISARRRILAELVFTGA